MSVYMMSSSFGSSSSAHFLLLTCFLTAQLLISSAASDRRCLDSERRALLQFKKDLEDPDNLLSSWQGPECCKWMGVSCNNQTGLVTGIDLHNPYGPYPLKFNSTNESGVWNLSGGISPSLLQLKSLSYLDLSGSMFASILIPEFIGSLAGLKYLNLSKAGFTGTIPAHLGNLSMLRYLDLSSSHPPLMVDDFHWISGLTSLIHLAMNGIDLSMIGVDWFHTLNRLSSLRELHLQACSLSGFAQSLPIVNLTSLAVMNLAFNSFSSAVPTWFANLTSLAHVDIISAGLHGSIPVELSELPSLRYLDLSMNENLTADFSKLVGGQWRRIENLMLASDHLTGPLPSSIGNMTTLVELDISDNEIEGRIPSSLGKLCNLRTLDLSGNNLSLGLPESLEGNSGCNSKGPLPDLAHLILSNNHITGILPEWLGELHNLIVLNLGYNAIQGPVPPFMGRLLLLNTIKLQGNELNGTLPQALGQLSELLTFDVSSNQLTGTVMEAHFSKLTNLKILSMSSNSLAIDVSSGWVPPFHVTNLGMRSCSLGPRFPLWLQHQKKQKLQFLDISDASISDKIPTWFWDLSTSLSLLNLSFNQIKGQLPSSLKFVPFADIDMRSNLLSGPIPVLTNEVELLDLSHNQFSGVIPSDMGELHPNLIYLSLSDNNLSGMIPASIGQMQSLQVIDLSRNRLMGAIPASLQSCSYLKALDLQHNNLSGSIPSSLGSLKQLHVLQLSDNMLSGEIPSSLQHCSSLETLDLGNNELDGGIPTWLEENLTLRILRLRSNRFAGQIPSQLAALSSLQVLDLAKNVLVGTIPRTFGYLKGMVSEQKVNEYLLYGQYRGSYYEESMSMQVNGKELVYTKTLSLVTCIDLSGNKLTGDFPETLTNLLGLLVLDLSNNQLRGNMPDKIGDMHAVLSLDLSNNGFSGSIPSSMASMTFMSYLNLSNNNLSGRIPATGQFQTLGASAFSGNAYLCGLPLAVQCEESKADHSDDEPSGDGDGAFYDEWFYVSVGLGFSVGLLGLCAVILMRNSWRVACFDFVDWMIGKVAMNK